MNGEGLCLSPYVGASSNEAKMRVRVPLGPTTAYGRYHHLRDVARLGKLSTHRGLAIPMSGVVLGTLW